MPYSSLPPSAFWRMAVRDVPPTDPLGIYKKKFDITPRSRIVTAGSCFAQHIARELRAKNFNVIDMEPAPRRLSHDNAKKFGYSLYSARYGNIYTVRQLLQLFSEAINRFNPADAVWQRDSQFFDALRPAVEPSGLSSKNEVIEHRIAHLRKVARLIRSVDVMVFTFGLTETWIHTESGTVYPTAPGTIAGQYDPNKHSFKNFTFEEIYKDFLAVRRLLQRYNPGIKFIITVSPVPLTATASGQHVLTASTYSKAILRTVAGQLSENFDDVDYFPSYEIVTNPAARSAFFDGNLRSVSSNAVATVMNVFFNEHLGETFDKEFTCQAHAQNSSINDDIDVVAAEDNNVVCEEMLLDAFAR